MSRPLALRAAAPGLICAALCAFGCGSPREVYVGGDQPLTDRSPSVPLDAGEQSASGDGQSQLPPASGDGDSAEDGDGDSAVGTGGDSAGGDGDAGDGDDASGEAPASSSDAAVADCPDGMLDCDGRADNGCEADISDDRDNCGACGVACPSADCECEAGVRVLVCPAGRGDCDGKLENGCETDLQSSATHCGGCGRECHDRGNLATSAACVEGRCEVTCEVPLLQGDCDGNPDNGCEANLWVDSDNCGACGKQCLCHDGRCISGGD